MKIERTELNIMGKFLQVIGFVLGVCLANMAPACVLGPIMLIIGLFADKMNSNAILFGIVLSFLGILIIYLIRKDIDIENIFNNWVKANFGHQVITEIPDDVQKTNTSKDKNILRLSSNRTNDAMSNTNISNKTNFGNFVSKETDKIIKENNFTDSKDKEAAKLFAINNILHSPKALSDIYNIPVSKAKEVEEEISIKEEKKVANHIAYEGRISIKDKNRIKSLLGYKCSACGADMSEIYGDIGHNYIELHHKIPYADMKENETRTLTENEFCVLCPNCHRMIHKLPNAGDIDLLSRIVKLNKKD